MMENKNRQINQRAKNKGYTVNATAAYTLNCVDRHSRVTCQSWHVYVSLRPGSQNLWAKRAERCLGRKNRRGGGFPGVNGAWPRWKCMQYVKKGQVPIRIKLFKCCTVGVAVYSTLTSPLIHLSASPIKAVRVRVSHLQPLQNLLNLFIPLLYRFSHRFFPVWKSSQSRNPFLDVFRSLLDLVSNYYTSGMLFYLATCILQQLQRNSLIYFICFLVCYFGRYCKGAQSASGWTNFKCEVIFTDFLQNWSHRW